jgi:hypothetical protein
MEGDKPTVGRSVRRLIGGAAGLAGIVLAGPIGNSNYLTCHLFLGSICGVSSYRTTELADRWFGWAALSLGCLLVGWAIGAGRRSNPSASKSARVLFGLRWSWLPAVVTAAILAVACRNSGPTTQLVVTVVNAPPGRPTSTTLRQDIRPSVTSWFRQSWDHLLGLPIGGYDRPNEHSQDRESRFLLVSPGASLERWKTGPLTIVVSTREEGSKIGGYIQVDLVPRESSSAPIEYRIPVKDAHRCPNEEVTGACYWMNLGYRDGADSVHLIVDFEDIQGTSQ